VKRRDFFLVSASSCLIPLIGRAAAPCPPPQVSVNGANTVTTPCGPAAANSYTTNFPGTENPISEGGKWSNVGGDWTPVKTTPGLACGTNGAKDAYDDSYAHLSGFGADQTAEATIYIASGIPSSESHEVELLLRWADSAHNARGYECLLNFLGGMQIMRWDGAFGAFTGIGAGQVSTPLKSGDVFKATITGNVIRVYYNGELKCSATDSTYSTGNPGIAFFKRVSGSNSAFGFSKFTATSS